MIGYLITAYVGYMRIALPRLLRSMMNSGVDPTNIFVAVSGWHDCGQETIDGINYWYPEHQSFEVTGLIEASRRDVSGITHWFFTPETAEVGPCFKKLVEGGLEIQRDVVSVNGGECMMNLFTDAYLKEKREFFNGMVGADKDRNVSYEFATCAQCSLRQGVDSIGILDASNMVNGMFTEPGR